MGARYRLNIAITARILRQSLLAAVRGVALGCAHET